MLYIETFLALKNNSPYTRKNLLLKFLIDGHQQQLLTST